MKVISLGAGVQSSTLFLMSCLGEIEKADVAIFADTQGEPPDVYTHLDYLSEFGDKHGISVHRVTKGDLLADFMQFVEGSAKRATMLPLQTRNPDTGLPGGLLGRQCTRDYKLYPIRAKTRALLKERGETRAEMWIGISTDEINRMKESTVAFAKNRWPLIELRMSRQDCLAWYEGKAFPKPPRSACYYCPFHSNTEWQRIRDANPDLWSQAVEIDRKVRNFRAVRYENYLHKSRVPLDEAVLDVDVGQIDMFDNECEGMCGV